MFNAKKSIIKIICILCVFLICCSCSPDVHYDKFNSELTSILTLYGISVPDSAVLVRAVDMQLARDPALYVDFDVLRADLLKIFDYTKWREGDIQNIVSYGTVNTLYTVQWIYAIESSKAPPTLKVNIYDEDLCRISLYSDDYRPERR